MRLVTTGLCLAAAALLTTVQTGAIAADNLFQKAVKEYNSRDYKLAHGHFESYLRANPNDANAMYYFALCWYQLGRADMARQQYNKIIQIAPSSAAAGYARTALAAMTPGARSATPSNARSVASVSSASAATPDDDDMRNLPDRASFYFTKESGGHMAVNVMINGHQVPCLFDTGAGAFFYKDQLVAAGVDCNKARPAGQTRGWAGTPVPIFAMPAEVRLGNLTRTIMITMEESASGLNKNLIGQTMIQGYQYEIDDKGGRVDLKKTISNTEQRVDSLYDVPLTVEGSRDIIMIEVNGHKVPAFIDTGSAFTIVNSSTAQACGIESTGTQGMMGVGGALTVGVGTAKIRLGPISKEFTVRIGGSAGCCIGQDFMEGWRFKTDREHGLLRFFH